MKRRSSADLPSLYTGAPHTLRRGFGCPGLTTPLSSWGLGWTTAMASVLPSFGIPWLPASFLLDALLKAQTPGRWGAEGSAYAGCRQPRLKPEPSPGSQEALTPECEQASLPGLQSAHGLASSLRSESQSHQGLEQDIHFFSNQRTRQLRRNGFHLFFFKKP